MPPEDNKPEGAISAIGRLTTYTYSGPVTWPRGRHGAETSTSSADRAPAPLKLMDGSNRIVTYIIDEVSGRLREKE